MTFAEVFEAAFANGPSCTRAWSTYARYFVIITMFVTYFGTCSVSVIIMAENAKQMYEYYVDIEISVRVYMLILLVPLVILSSIRNLKYVTPFSMVANVCMGTGLAISVYYFTQHLPKLEQRPMVNDVTAIASAIAITIFAVNIIGMIMPLENQMKTPQQFIVVLCDFL